LRYASKKYWRQLAKDLRGILTTPTEAAAEQRFAESGQVWGGRYPAIIRLWRSSWEQFTPFLSFPPEIRKIVYTTDENVNPPRWGGARAAPAAAA
jgi:transposase-like protein